ncbi:MAG: transglycosylase SLT domain-containing protein [Cocleimonas sp.]|nr:transglycosylase SLT domain-containing protein [Cocleimonas sp.]
MKGKQSLAVVISAILSLAGVTGCSNTAPKVKQAAKYQHTKNSARSSKIPRHVSDRQIFNEIYADAVALGFDKRTMATYKQRGSGQKQQRVAKNRQTPRNKRYTKKYVKQTPRYKRPAPRYARAKPRYKKRPAPRRNQPAARYNKRYTKQYVKHTPRYSRPTPRYRQVARVNRTWVRPAVHRPVVQASRPRYTPRTNTPQQYNRGGNVWNRVKGGFRMGTELHNPTVKKVLRQYARNPARLNRIFSRSTEYMHFILHELKRRNMPTELALLPMVESAFKNKAVSRSGAAGMWQFMPATGKDFGLRRSTGFDARMDIFASTKAALTYLQKINKEFKGDWYLTLAAYNVGQNRIHRERAKNRLKGRRTDYWSLSIPKETREYVPRLLAYKEILLHPQKYGVRLPQVSNNAVMTQTNVNRSIDLRRAARMAGLPAATLVRLNPNFKNGITNPHLSRKVVLPRQFADRLHHAIQNSPTAKSYRPQRKSRTYSRRGGRLVKHRVRRGETLHKIAARYGTTIAKIMRLNRMRSTRLITGSRLKIATRGTSRRRG